MDWVLIAIKDMPIFIFLGGMYIRFEHRMTRVETKIEFLCKELYKYRRK